MCGGVCLAPLPLSVENTFCLVYSCLMQDAGSFTYTKLHSGFCEYFIILMQFVLAGSYII